MVWVASAPCDQKDHRRAIAATRRRQVLGNCGASGSHERLPAILRTISLVLRWAYKIFAFWLLSTFSFSSIATHHACRWAHPCACAHTHKGTHPPSASTQENGADQISKDSSVIALCDRMLHPQHLCLLTY